MTVLLRIATVFLAVVFVSMGMSWFVDPAASAARLGMPLMDGVGRSSQVADFAAFFIVAGSCVLLGVGTRKRLWFYPIVMLLSVAASGRILAWLLHDAALTLEMIVFECVVAIVLVVASKTLTDA